MRWSLGALLVVLSCTPLHDLQLGVCGNGVLESGEDCDTFVDPTLMTGGHCGLDADLPNQRCRYVCERGRPDTCPRGWGCGPDGVCRYGVALEAVSAVELSTGAPSVRVGDVDHDGFWDQVIVGAQATTVRFGPDFTSRELLAVEANDTFAIADFDGTGTLDFAFARDRGLSVFLTRPDRSITAVPLASAQLGTEQVRVAPMSPLLGLAQTKDGGTQLALIEAGDGGGWKVTPVGAPVNAALPGRVFPANVDDSPGDELALLTAGDRVVIFSADGGPRGSIDLPRDAGRWSSTVVLARVDGDALVDAFAFQQDGGCAFFKNVSDGGPSLAFEPAPLKGAVPGQALAFGDLDRDGWLDLVTTRGVFRATGEPRYPAGGVAITEAAVGDFNRDGWPDVAAAVGAASLAILLQKPDAGFNPLPIQLEGRATMLRVGDFDGDLVDDLLFVEKVDQDDRVAIVYGATSGGPSAPLRLGGAARIESIEAVQLDTPLDEISDFVGVFVSARQSRNVVFAHGTPGRAIVSTFNSPASVLPATIASGRFSFEGSPPRPALLVNFEAPFFFPAPNWQDFAPFDAGSFSPLGQCGGFVVANFNDEPSDEVILVCPGSVRVVDVARRLVRAVEVPTLDFPVATAAQDLDGDGMPELIATFQGADAGVVIFSADGGLQALRVPGAVHAVALPLGRDGAPALVVLTQRALRLAMGDGGLDLALDAPVPLGARLAVRDFDGDGVDDVAVQAPTLRVFRTLPHDEVKQP